MTRPPVVAVTFDSTQIGEFELWQDMFAGVVRAGCVPVGVDCGVVRTDVTALLDGVDGVLVSGGGDVEPTRYGGDPRDPALMNVNPCRDANELAVLAWARAAGVPVLAICRGMQLLNVALGGTLTADLTRDRPGPVRHRLTERDLARAVHDVDVVPDSLLATLLGRGGVVGVNSQHHQGVDTVADGLVVVARAGDGLVEAVEHVTEPLVGVQWHPEVLWRQEEHAARLLTWFSRFVREEAGGTAPRVG